MCAQPLIASLIIACTSGNGSRLPTAGVGTPTSPQAPPAAVPATKTLPPGPSATSPTELIQQIASALEGNDVGAIAQMISETEVDCRTSCPSGGCDPNQCGQVRRGVPFGPWASEFTIINRQDVYGTLARFYATPQPQMSDQYGSGALRVYGIGTDNGQIFDAVTTLIQQDGRRAVLLRLQNDGGSWSIGSVVQVGTPLVDAVLGGDGDYRIVQPWP